MSRHVPVLLHEVIDSLQLKPGIKVIDCTLGDAGHSEAILERTAPTGKLLGLDADAESLLRAKQYLYNFGERATFVRSNFARLEEIAQAEQFVPVEAILFDLGWSSPQFEERGRGFSFEKDEPLDMRYGVNAQPGGESQTAAQVINSLSEVELAKIFKMYGEEKFSGEIAKAIIQARKVQPIERTTQLVAVILDVYRTALHSTKEVPWIGGLHPATKVFQALRIVVNEELTVLKKVLPQAVNILAPGGRLAVISFHSLEDRIVKHFFQSQEHKTIKIITKKPLVATEAELSTNPRARSAKLRVVEKN